MMTEPVTISQADVRKLLSAASPEGALLYLYLQGGNRLETAGKDLNINESRLGFATAVLRQLGLLPQERPGNTIVGERPNYSGEDVSRANYDFEFVGLKEEVQRQFGKILNVEEEKILLGFYRYLGLSPDVISLLVSYCISRAKRQGKIRNPSLWTIEKEAYAWAERGIDSFEEASAYIQMQDQRQSRLGRLMQMLQIHGRKLTAAEERHANAWLDMGMEDEVIAMAYERTCLNTGGLNWAYMNKILQRWHSQGLHTADEVRSGDQRGSVPKGASGQLGAAELEAIQRVLREG